MADQRRRVAGRKLRAAHKWDRSIGEIVSPLAVYHTPARRRRSIGPGDFYNVKTMKAAIVLVVLAVSVLLFASPPVVSCPCDHAKPETLAARVCSLCKEADSQSTEVFFLKDINPHKPHRYLALPKGHDRELQAVGTMGADERERYWQAAIAKAEELYPGGWGLASNGHLFRTQCHAHLHIGPLSPDVSESGGSLFDHPKDFPHTGPEQGVWVHPRAGKFCLHLDRALAEVVLER